MQLHDAIANAFWVEALEARLNFEKDDIRIQQPDELENVTAVFNILSLTVEVLKLSDTACVMRCEATVQQQACGKAYTCTPHALQYCNEPLNPHRSAGGDFYI